ncbi:hypothetical protein BGZ98_008278 [Dissophora globulifera]|nr:hypothetical protein BGZ98_008278 [Dissophora globulifera]
MVQLTLPLLDNTDNESDNSTLPYCDPSQSIYDKRSCIKDSLFCSDDNPCPSQISCIDRVCQCQPNTNSFITLIPQPVKMYTIGCNFDTQRVFDTPCRDYEYSVPSRDNQTTVCLLNYCSNQVPCYAGSCDNSRNVCVNITSTAPGRPLPPPNGNAVISLGDDPFGTHTTGLSPVLIILMAAGGVVALGIVGCVIKTALRWTRGSVEWASSGSKQGAENIRDEKTRAIDHKDPKEESVSAMQRKPSRFTGAHYVPSPLLTPVELPLTSLSSTAASNDISPFSTPYLSPYAAPLNQSQISNSSIALNPFMQRPEETDSNSRQSTIDHSDDGSIVSIAIESSERNESLRSPRQEVSTPDIRISRSMTTSGGPGLTRETAPLRKSMSIQHMGSRPAPPSPAAHSQSFSSATPL